MGSATVLMVFLPSSNSDFSRALNSSRGKSRNSLAMRSSGSTLVSTFAGLPYARATINSTALFSCSIFFASPFPGPRERLGIGTLHARPQTCQRAKLQLLHSAFRLADLPRHFLNTFLLHEPQHYHPTLLHRQRVDQPKQSSPPLHFLEFHATSRRRRDLLRLIRDILAAHA